MPIPFALRIRENHKSEIMLEFTITSEFMSPLALIVCLAGSVAFCLALALLTERNKKQS